MTGKFQGVIAAQIPTGRLTVNMRRLRSVVGISSPFIRLASSAAMWRYSPDSAMSSIASALNGLPCSIVRMRAMSSTRSCQIS